MNSVNDNLIDRHRGAQHHLEEFVRCSNSSGMSEWPER
jgi:hypothetical protein